MATRFYLHWADAPYTPATFKGAWDSTGSSYTKVIDTCRLPYAGDGIGQPGANITGTAPYDVCFYRGVSGPLAAATIGTGTFNLCLGVRQDQAGMDGYWHVHIYVTQGDSDSVRGTLLSDYTENTTNEWNASHLGIALQSAQSLSSVAVSAGDRLVIELGVVKRGSSSSWCWMDVGTPGGVPDLTVGGPGASRPGWIEFSETITGTATERVTQGPVETLLTETTRSGLVSQAPVEVLMTDDANPARITHVAAEVIDAQPRPTRISQIVAELLAPSVIETRATQLVAEAMAITVLESRITQAVAEIANAQINPMRLSQLLVEVLAKTSSYCGEPTLSPADLCAKSDVLAWLEWTVPMREN